MKILALDLGTRTGWAHWDGHRIESGVQNFALERGESPGMRFVRFNRWLADVGQEFTFRAGLGGPDLAVYEKPHHRGGAATEIACGFSTRVHEFCARQGIEYASVHTSSLKLFATGKGNASKEDMIAAACRRWPEQSSKAPPRSGPMYGYPLTPDQADALWVLEWARWKFDETHATNGGATK